jgi:uncharacterized protein involved in exopolysaccharide biosynthesis
MDLTPPPGEGESRPRAVLNGDEDIPLIAYLNVLLRYRRVVVLAALIGAVGVVGLGVVFGGYRAHAVFAPVVGSQSPLGDVASLAAKFGINVAGSVGSPVGLYADLPQTDGLLAQLAQTRFTFPTDASGRDTLTGTLVELLKARGDSPEERLQDAVDKLRRKVDASADLGPGTVTVETHAAWPVLAEKMTRRILDLVNVFNVEQLQSQARAEREFVEARVHAAQGELEQAENDLEAFLTKNRTYQTSPKLTIEVGRLQRRIDLRQQTYTTLVGEYEEARIREIRNTPVITVVDSPEGSARVRFKVLALALVGLAVGGAFGVILAFLLQYFASLRRESSSELEILQGLLATAGRELRLTKLLPRSESTKSSSP